MKGKARYIVEAAYLVPGICILLVYLVFFTLYAHDYAVCVHTALETGIKGCYPDGRTDRQVKAELEQELLQKLSGRLLWLEDRAVEVKVDPVRIRIQVSGSGSFLPMDGIKVQQTVCRVQPCETVRRSRWLLDKEESPDDKKEEISIGSAR